jgi:damage-control phosphatase, subfamily I
MRTSLTCIPCIVRQTLAAIRFSTGNAQIQHRALRDVLRLLAEADLTQSPPHIVQIVQRQVRAAVGVEDPYRWAKDRLMELALGLYPTLASHVRMAPEPFDAALRLAIAGNVIDMGVNADIDERTVHDAISHALESPVSGEVHELADAVASAGDILYLADNASELVFDRILIEQLAPDGVTVAVRGGPVLNDATKQDAAAAGLAGLVDVIDNGSDAPGTILEDCSPEFRERFDRADVVIAKGQGNYETLCDVDRDVFFALKVKCPLIAKRIGSNVGDLVLRWRGPELGAESATAVAGRSSAEKETIEVTPDGAAEKE